MTTAIPALLLLIRHGEQSTLEERDPDLSSRGCDQAQRLADRLASLPVTAVVASSLRRAHQTAWPTAERFDLAIETEAGLDEIRMDEAEARRRFESVARGEIAEPSIDPGDPTAMVRLMPYFAWPTTGPGETAAEFRHRVLAAVDSILARHPSGVIACIAHGGTINAILGQWIDAREDLWFAAGHAGISAVLVTGEQRVLLSLNDTSHLDPAEDLVAMLAGASITAQ